MKLAMTVVSVGLLAATMLLASCASTQNGENARYLNDDQTVAPIVVNNNGKSESYYAVPVISTTSKASPSLYPPTIAAKSASSVSSEA